MQPRLAPTYAGRAGLATIAAAVLERLLHHSHALVIKGDSFRLKAKKKGWTRGREPGTLNIWVGQFSRRNWGSSWYRLPACGCSAGVRLWRWLRRWPRRDSNRRSRCAPLAYPEPRGKMAKDGDKVFVDDVDVPRDVAALIDAARKRNEPPPRPHQLRRWGGALTVRCNEEARVLELARARTLPIEVPGLDVVWCVAGDSTRFALGLRNGELCFVREQGRAWGRVTLRRDVHLMDPRDISLEASGEMALLRWTRSSDLMHWWSGRWRELPPGYPVLVERDQIWVCRYSEWGSELVCWSPSGALLDAGNFTLVRPVRLVRASAEALVVAGGAPQNASCSWLCDAARHNVDPHRDSCLYVGRWAAGRKQPLLAIGYVAGIEALADLGRAVPASESAIDTFLARSA